MITLLAIGKKHELRIKPGLERYQARLKAPFNIEWVLLPHSSFEGGKARKEESDRLRSRLKPSDYVVLLDEIGDQWSSPTLSANLERWFVEGHNVVLIIGGAYGVDEQLKAAVNAQLSLSKMVFPHQLVRLLLVEQLYRAQEIARGSGYHHS